MSGEAASGLLRLMPFAALLGIELDTAAPAEVRAGFRGRRRPARPAAP